MTCRGRSRPPCSKAEWNFRALPTNTNNMNGPIVFFKYDSELIPCSEPLPNGYDSEFWRPSWRRGRPPGVDGSSFIVWWLFHVGRIFANRDYGVLLVRRKGCVVHRSTVTPPYFRFPFMQPDDLQVGDTWTHEEERGKGLATWALRFVVNANPKSGRHYWYLTEGSNYPSLQVAAKSGFRKIGTGVRTSRLGLRILGSYQLCEELHAGQ